MDHGAWRTGDLFVGGGKGVKVHIVRPKTRGHDLNTSYCGTETPEYGGRLVASATDEAMCRRCVKAKAQAAQPTEQYPGVEFA